MPASAASCLVPLDAHRSALRRHRQRVNTANPQPRAPFCCAGRRRQPAVWLGRLAALPSLRRLWRQHGQQRQQRAQPEPDARVLCPPLHAWGPQEQRLWIPPGRQQQQRRRPAALALGAAAAGGGRRAAWPRAAPWCPQLLSQGLDLPGRRQQAAVRSAKKEDKGGAPLLRELKCGKC